MPRNPKSKKSSRNTNRGRSTAARDAAARKETRKAMVVGTPAAPPVEVDLDVDPTVISTADVAPGHPTGELDNPETQEQVVGQPREAAAEEEEEKPE